MSESKQYEQQQISQWADLMGQLFDRLTGKEAGLQGQNPGSAKWVFNGELVIKAQTNNSNGIER